MYQSGDGSNLFTDCRVVTEPEVVYYPDTKSLAVQCHPELMDSSSSGWQYFQSLLEEYS